MKFEQVYFNSFVFLHVIMSLSCMCFFVKKSDWLFFQIGIIVIKDKEHAVSRFGFYTRAYMLFCSQLMGKI